MELARLIREQRVRGEVQSSSEEESEEEEEGDGWRDSTGEIQFERADVLSGEEIEGGPWDLV